MFFTVARIYIYYPNCNIQYIEEKIKIGTPLLRMDIPCVNIRIEFHQFAANTAAIHLTFSVLQLNSIGSLFYHEPLTNSDTPTGENEVDSARIYRIGFSISVRLLNVPPPMLEPYAHDASVQ